MIINSRWYIFISFATLFIYISPVKSFSANEKDSLLIANMQVQIQATQALNDMYNFKFTEAKWQFYRLKILYREHPLPYFLMGLNEWWKIMPDLNVEQYDLEFLAYMDTSIMKAKKLYEVDITKIEGAFFLAAAYGFKARLYSERKKWLKAAGNGNKALNYMDDCRSKEELSPELLFGDGIINYFSVWIRENYPQLRPFLIMFEKGDKELGLEQLREVAHNAFYTRTEAQYWLMRILFIEENDTQGALHESEYLHETYPDNAFFHRFYASLLYQTGRLAKAKLVSEDLLMKVDSNYVGYEANSGRYACYFLARIWESNLDQDKAFQYYQRAIEFAEANKSLKSNYYLYSLLGLARIYDKRGNRPEAESCLKTIRKNSKRKNSANKLAREYLKSLRHDGD
ncbi:MAG: tol-pal system protein YbgF [Cytophagales bacterium]|nr:tol-pal system protein YbgF [Cytophagales bacterium]